MSEKPVRGLLLRLPKSVREQAIEKAHADGTSINFFITQAVAEKIERMHSRPTATETKPDEPEKERPQAAAGANGAS